ncbi:MAG TPA: NAD(P)-dependent oxidoreductase [Alphaproteobacteria bacterium]|nr:NAD(P)-dependent oxidoreductase [Alphaproteobacteria bacterium]
MPESSILITGVNGMIGFALARRLAAEDRRVVGMDRVLPPDGDLNCPVVTAELSDPHRLHWTIRHYGVDRIVHCGAYSGPMLQRDNPFQMLETNVVGTMHVVEAARVAGLRRVVFLSSIVAYGPQPMDRAVPESACLLADEPYGASKVCGEAILRAYSARHGLAGVALRVTAVYGPRRTTDCLIRLMIRNGFAGVTTHVPYGAAWRRQYVNVEDVVSAIVAALDRKNLPQAAYNISGGINPTLEEVAKAVAAAVPEAHVEFGSEAHPFDQPIGPLDIAAAKRDLGYVPRVSLVDGIAAYAAWLKANGGSRESKGGR